MPRNRSAQAVDPLLNIYEIAARTGHTPDRIRHLRVKGHELYSRAWKAGDTHSSPLRLEESIVAEWVRGRQDAAGRRLS